MNKQEIRQLLNPYDLPHLDSESATRVFAWLLKQKDEDFVIQLGTVELHGQQFWPHYWIEMENGLVVDYRACAHLPDDDVPCGVFNPDDYDGVIYLPEKDPRIVVTKTMFEMLVRVGAEGDDG